MADKQKNKGQYFTSIRTARFMAEKYCPVSRVVSILDPGAGNGSLGAAVAEHLIKDDLCDSISITFIPFSHNETRFKKLLTNLKENITYGEFKGFVTINEQTIEFNEVIGYALKSYYKW